MYRILRALKLPAAAMLMGLLTAACEGSNCFRTPTGACGGGETPTDTTTPAPDIIAPTVAIQLPADSSVVAVGDSVFVRVRATDNRRVAKVILEGYARIGDPNLGTDQKVFRYITKEIDLSGVTAAVRDTILQRYLLANTDSTPARRVRIVATALDSAGNAAVDTAFIHIGGPRVQIVAPVSGTPIPAGGQITVTVVAQDRIDQIRSVRIRATGLPTPFDQTFNFTTPLDSVSQTVTIPVPANAPAGTVTINASALSGSNLEANASPPVTVTITAPITDTTRPSVQFNFTAPDRLQVTDSIAITLSATDNNRVDSLGFTVLARYRSATGAAVDTVRRQAQGAAATLYFRLADLTPAITLTDTTTLTIELTAWAIDPARNCGAAISPNLLQSLECSQSGVFRFANGLAGRQASTLVTRGGTIAFPGGTGDRHPDIVSDGNLVFVSNFDDNTVEILPVAGAAFSSTVEVGSKPWGLALGRSGDSVFVANSGGTSIDVLAIAGGGATNARRITPPDISLFDVTFDVQVDTIQTVVERNYSDRPQFLGQVAGGQLLYSTVPTPSAADGTVRIYDPNKDVTYQFGRGSEIFTPYAAPTANRAIVVNALSAAKVIGGFGDMIVCPRRLLASQGADPACVVGDISEVRDALIALRAANQTDTRLDVGQDASTIGLSDTTFVATSTDHSAIAFGEGARDPGRILYFRSAGANLVGTTRETRDLIGNASERVIGLGLNFDGSLGVARGNQVYFFGSDLRLQGTVTSGSPTGGSAMHPLNANYPNNDGRRLGFSSGVDANGVPFIDVINTFSFRSLRRLLLRDRVIGTVIAVPLQGGDPEAGIYVLRLFALTEAGVIRIGLTAADLAGS